MTFANVTMAFALVFAMSGGAYAAGKYLITSTKQISPKVLKQLAGKPGAAGKAGAAGPAGATGPAGPAGKEGAAGKEGTEGKAGADGESVVMKTESKGAHCKEGGVSFSVSSKTEYACNGQEGSPWSAGGTLPKGASEKGEWAVAQAVVKGVLEGGEEFAATGLSFNIPLAAALDQAHVHFMWAGEGEGETKPGAAITNHECEGTYLKPIAASGNLCVFAQFAQNADEATNPIGGVAGAGAEEMGTGLLFYPANKGEFLAKGSWAVTG